jgi:hypothetical protein
MKSVFAKYKPDNELLIAQCFLFDWEKTRIEKLLKSEPGNVLACKDYVMKNYVYLRNAYKWYSGESAQGRLPSIGSTIFSVAINECPDLVDGSVIKPSDVDL